MALMVKKKKNKKHPPANAGDVDLIPGSGRSPGGGHANPLQCSCLGNPKDRGPSWATVHKFAELDTMKVTHASIYNVILLVCFLSQNPWTNQESAVKQQAASISSKRSSLEPVSALSYFNQQPIIFQKLYSVSEMDFY